MNFNILKTNLFFKFSIFILLQFSVINNVLGETSRFATELLSAIVSDNANQIQLLAKAGCDFNKQVNNIPPILIALMSQKNIALEALIDAHADVDIFYLGQTLVEFCIKNNYPQSAYWLISKGANFSDWSDNETDAMYYAIHRRYEELVYQLIRNSYDIHKIKPVTNIALINDSKMLSYFLKLGINPNLVFNYNNQNRTLLSFACHGNIESTKVLIAAGADINQKIDGKSPLAYALESANSELIKLLLDNGAVL